MTIATRAISALCIALFAAGGAVAADDPLLLSGAPSATFSWTPATGPVEGYYVIIKRNGGPSSAYGYSNDTVETITGEYGDTIIVQVAAYDANGLSGPLSVPSQPIAFSPPTSATTSGAGTLPGDGGGTAPLPIAPLDFTGDGVSDLLVREGQTGALSLWTMDGSVVMGATDLPLQALPWRIAGNADYDGNGVADILWQDEETDEIAIWSMAAGAVLTTAQYDLAGLETDGRWTVEGSGDFDGDGAADIALMNHTIGAIEILRLETSGAIVPWTRFEAYRGAWTIAATADLDGDGISEIVWSDEGEDRLVVWTLDGINIADAIMLPAAPDGSRVVGCGDHDGDGMADLLLRNPATQQTQIWFMAGASVAGSMDLPAGMSEAWQPIAGGGDYDADGNADLVWSNADTGEIAIWFTTPPTIVAEEVSGAALAAGEWVASGAERADDSAFRRKLCSGDLNGDGVVGAPDFGLFVPCLGQSGSGSCEGADLDSDGFVDETDFGLMAQLFGSPECAKGF